MVEIKEENTAKSILAEDKMEVCSCNTGAKAVFYCTKIIKCKGQVYYCIHCGENIHDHKLKLISSLLNKSQSEWNSIFDIAQETFNEAELRFDKLQPLLEFIQSTNEKLTDHKYTGKTVQYDIEQLRLLKVKILENKKKEIEKLIKDGKLKELEDFNGDREEYQLELLQYSYLNNLDEIEIQKRYTGVFKQGITQENLAQLQKQSPESLPQIIPLLFNGLYSQSSDIIKQGGNASWVKFQSSSISQQTTAKVQNYESYVQTQVAKVNKSIKQIVFDQIDNMNKQKFKEHFSWLEGLYKESQKQLAQLVEESLCTHYQEEYTEGNHQGCIIQIRLLRRELLRFKQLTYDLIRGTIHDQPTSFAKFIHLRIRQVIHTDRTISQMVKLTQKFNGAFIAGDEQNKVCLYDPTTFEIKNMLNSLYTTQIQSMLQIKDILFLTYYPNTLSMVNLQEDLKQMCIISLTSEGSQLSEGADNHILVGQTNGALSLHKYLHDEIIRTKAHQVFNNNITVTKILQLQAPNSLFALASSGQGVKIISIDFTTCDFQQKFHVDTGNQIFDIVQISNSQVFYKIEGGNFRFYNYETNAIEDKGILQNPAIRSMVLFPQFDLKTHPFILMKSHQGQIFIYNASSLKLIYIIQMTLHANNNYNNQLYFIEEEDSLVFGTTCNKDLIKYEIDIDFINMIKSF